MKKNIILISLSLMILSCGVKQTEEESEIDRKARLDSFTLEKYGKTSDEVVKDRVNESLTRALFDTVGLSTAPVKVIKATLFTKEYSNYRDIRLTYKNVSTKKITAIKFKWHGLDAFGDPADMGGVSVVEGFGGGFTDTPLRSGRTETSEWSISSRNGKKVTLAWPTEVAFEDGTKWVIGE